MKKMKNNLKPTPAMVRGAVTIIKAHLDNEWAEGEKVDG